MLSDKINCRLISILLDQQSFVNNSIIMMLCVCVRACVRACVRVCVCNDRTEMTAQQLLLNYFHK